MMDTTGEFVLSRSGAAGDCIIGEWDVDADDIVVHLSGEEYRIKSGRDMRSQLYWFVRFLEKEHLGESVELKACATCQHFKVSGMSLDMAHGHIGNCDRHQIGVRLCHLCDDFERKKSEGE